MTSSSITAAMGGRDEDRTAIWVQIPDGYIPLPLDDIGPQMAQAQEIVEEVGPEESRATVASLVGVLTVFLHDLADAQRRLLRHSPPRLRDRRLEDHLVACRRASGVPGKGQSAHPAERPGADQGSRRRAGCRWTWSTCSAGQRCSWSGYASCRRRASWASHPRPRARRRRSSSWKRLCPPTTAPSWCRSNCPPHSSSTGRSFGGWSWRWPRRSRSPHRRRRPRVRARHIIVDRGRAARLM